MDIASLRGAVFATVHEFPARPGMNSVETAALLLNKQTGTVYNKASIDFDSADFTIGEVLTLMVTSADYRILQALAAVCFHAAVPLKDYRRTCDLELLDLLLPSRWPAATAPPRSAARSRTATSAPARSARSATPRSSRSPRNWRCWPGWRHSAMRGKPAPAPMRLVDNTQGRALKPQAVAQALAFLYSDDLLRRLAQRQAGGR